MYDNYGITRGIQKPEFSSGDNGGVRVLPSIYSSLNIFKVGSFTKSNFYLLKFIKLSYILSVVKFKHVCLCFI